jgi:methylmalonyl-CoA mutase cobalamin-binding subunit
MRSRSCPQALTGWPGVWARAGVRTGRELLQPSDLGKHGGRGACPAGRGAAAAGYARVADGLLSAAARRLGEMWQRDELSFFEVSIAVSLIFRLNHDHAQRHVPIAREPDLRQAVFATLPGQAHNLGLVLAAEAFRQADWQVTLLLDSATGLILDRVRRLRPEIVGLSVSNLDRTHQVERLISDLRALAGRFRILLGGTAAERSMVRCPRHRAFRWSTISSPRSTRCEARSAGDVDADIAEGGPASSVRNASGASAKPWRAPITGRSAWAPPRGSARQTAPWSRP